VLVPSLALQRLTTRQPQKEQIEVALSALKQVLEADKPAQELASEIPISSENTSAVGSPDKLTDFHD
jgi:uncharacterized protein YqhQ